jgi:hypothetical protein
VAYCGLTGCDFGVGKYMRTLNNYVWRPRSGDICVFVNEKQNSWTTQVLIDIPFNRNRLVKSTQYPRNSCTGSQKISSPMQ